MANSRERKALDELLVEVKEPKINAIQKEAERMGRYDANWTACKYGVSPFNTCSSVVYDHFNDPLNRYPSSTLGTACQQFRLFSIKRSECKELWRAGYNRVAAAECQEITHQNYVQKRDKCQAELETYNDTVSISYAFKK